MDMKRKKEQEDGKKREPEQQASLYDQMKEFGIDADIKDTTKYCLMMCERL